MTRLQSIQLLGFADNVRVAHWQAPRKTNEHETLGDLYGALSGPIDELTELAIARDGNLEFPADSIAIINRAPYADLLGGGLALLAEIRATFAADADDELTVLADIKRAIVRAAFKLEVVLP